MPVHYRDVPADDCDEEDGGAGRTATQPLELEAAHIRNDAQSMRRTSLYVAACFFALLVAMAAYGIRDGKEQSSPDATGAPHESYGGDASKTKSVDHSDGESKKGGNGKHVAALPRSSPHVVFCYGDSLTYGISPPGRQPYPYSIYLGQELNRLYGSDPAGTPAAIVQHLGKPGMTAAYMQSHIIDEQIGACRILSRIPNLSLMIILTGTNDLGVMTDAGMDVARSILGSIVDLHKGVLGCAEAEGNAMFHTLAISIPGSAYQSKVRIAADFASYINNALKGFAAYYPDDKVTYVDFPFEYQEGDPRWSSDGLHLSQAGYEELATSLAPHVKVILDKIDVSQSRLEHLEGGAHMVLRKQLIAWLKTSSSSISCTCISNSGKEHHF